MKQDYSPLGACRKTSHPRQHLSWHPRGRPKRINNTEESFQGRENDFCKIRKAWSLSGLKRMLYSGNNTINPNMPAFFYWRYWRDICFEAHSDSWPNSVPCVGRTALPTSILSVSWGPTLLVETTYIPCHGFHVDYPAAFHTTYLYDFSSCPLRHGLQKVLCF